MVSEDFMNIWTNQMQNTTAADRQSCIFHRNIILHLQPEVMEAFSYSVQNKKQRGQHD